jgi:hypothetical protein
MDRNTLSQTTLNTLNGLSQSFRPDDVKFLVSNSAESVQECNDDAIPLISGLQKYIENGHRVEGLDEATRATFGNIKVFKTNDRN